MILELSAFVQMAAACAPNVHVETLAPIARTESRFNTLAIGDNTVRGSYAPKSKDEALKIATRLMAKGHELDLGLMQINTRNLRGLGLSVADTFDACKSMKAGAKVLLDGWKPPPPGHDTQPALIRALSHYNTGNPERGVRNGYVGKVLASAKVVVPAIRSGAPLPAMRPAVTGAAAANVEPPAILQDAPPPPPPAAWDVYGHARAARAGPVQAPPAPQLEEAVSAPEPVQLRAVMAANDG